jgi:flagella basal body P-ring formation protein FlgA
MSLLNSPSLTSLRTTRASARVVILTFVGLWAGMDGAWASQPMDTTSAWQPKEEVEAEVRRELAGRWGVVPEALVLEWSQPRGGDIPEGYDRVQVIGHGRDGRWVISFRRGLGSRDAISVLLRSGVNIPRPIAQHVLERGEVVADGDMVMETRTHWGPVTDLPDPCALGWVTQRRIESGEILTKPGVKPPRLVVSGRSVQALWSNGRVELNIQATALGSAALGERVFVRTEDGTRLDGVVRGPGLVEIANSWTESGK